jgi:hypothetical protein
MIGYYRRFIEGFSSITKPMIALLEKAKEFKRTDQCQASFEEFKEEVDYNTCSNF